MNRKNNSNDNSNNNSNNNLDINSGKSIKEVSENNKNEEDDDHLPEYIIEEIMLNLKMVSRIKPNDKLFKEMSLFKIDNPTITQGIIRWMNDYSRSKTMDDLDQLVDNTSSIINSIFKKHTRTTDDNRHCQNILLDITKAITGIQNLKITYNDDTFIQSRLDIIQDKFEVCKNKLSEKLHLLSS